MNKIKIAMIIEIHKTGTYDYYEDVEVDIEEFDGMTSMFEVECKINEYSSNPTFSDVRQYYGGEFVLNEPYDEEISSYDHEFLELKEIIDRNRKEKEFDEKYQLKLDFNFED